MAVFKAVLLLGCLGLLTSSIYSLLVVAGVVRFWLRSRRAATASTARYAPPVSLFKPLHGAEPQLESCLRSFFEQDYTAPYEILFCARDEADEGLQTARRVAALYPTVAVQFLTVDGPVHVNAKVSSMQAMERAARYDMFVISDSDVRVTPSYLREVIADFADPQVGASTCLYRGVASRGLWSKLEAAGMSVEMTAGVLADGLLEQMQFLLGPTMSMRRSCVREMGGFARLGSYCADDFLLGREIARLGHRVVLSRHVIDHVVLNLSFLTSIKHQVRWMRSTRFSRPKGHFATVLTFGVPFGILAAASALLLGYSLAGAELLGLSVLARMLMAWIVAGLAVRDRSLLSTVLLYPLRDLMGVFFWAASYASETIVWRGRLYRLGEHGRMLPAGD